MTYSVSGGLVNAGQLYEDGVRTYTGGLVNEGALFMS